MAVSLAICISCQSSLNMYLLSIISVYMNGFRAALLLKPIIWECPGIREVQSDNEESSPSTRLGRWPSKKSKGRTLQVLQTNQIQEPTQTSGLLFWFTPWKVSAATKCSGISYQNFTVLIVCLLDILPLSLPATQSIMFTPFYYLGKQVEKGDFICLRSQISLLVRAKTRNFNISLLLMQSFI